MTAPFDGVDVIVTVNASPSGSLSLPRTSNVTGVSTAVPMALSSASGDKLITSHTNVVALRLPSASTAVTCTV